MKLCKAPFCQNPAHTRPGSGKLEGWCKEHIAERNKFNVRAYVELLPLWAFKRCKVHGLLNFDQCYRHKMKGKPHRFICRLCTMSYVNSQYCPNKAKASQVKRASGIRNARLKCIYGITLDEYNKILESQNNACAICNISTSLPTRKFFDVDHCHKTNKVRGLLCHSCNVGIGFLKDDIQILQKAISYLTTN